VNARASARANAAALAIGAALLCTFIGFGVTLNPPGAVDRAGRALTGELPYVALVFTASCWWYVLVAFAVAGIAFAVAVPSWRARVAFSLVITLIGWQASDAVKNFFARPRPDYGILHIETSASYPSGHAMFAVVVYGLWSYYVATSGLPAGLRRALSVLLALWGVGVLWSRLALGAHYVTDLLGGVLFGIAMLALGTALAPEATRAPSKRAAVAAAENP
jgi:membrane-associated phospholipid phosphatase